MINVTKPYLPDINKYKAYIDEIYSKGWLTNNGPLVKKLEQRLEEYLEVKNIVLVSNGTTALEVAYNLLDIKGEAITTPFSFVATTSSLVSNKIESIYADIEHDTFNLNVKNISSLITPRTSAIVPVHVFGNPSDVEDIDKIAKKSNLKVIYDAAHAFDVKYKGESILNYGDISVLSFHATKLFHTIEGGALIINDDSLIDKARKFINFGIKGEDSIPEFGINAKMNEFEAAMGLCVLDEIESIKKQRQKIYEVYRRELKGFVKFQKLKKDCTNNYSYFPVVFKDEDELITVKNSLNEKNIFPRRYFSISLDSLDYIQTKQYCEISRDITKRVLCLPLYVELKEDEQKLICDTIKNNIQGQI